METKKVLLILLAVFILFPLIFVGSCIPMAIVGSGLEATGGFEKGWGLMIIIPVTILCLAMAVFFCYKLIKKIVNSNPKDDSKSN